MVEIYKLIFDLALYYTLSGYYLIIGAHESPSTPGFIALCAAVALDAAARSRGVYQRAPRALRVLPLLLPLIAFLFRPALWQVLQVLPPWFYIGWCLLTDRVSLHYDVFRSHYAFALRALILLIFGPFITPQFGGVLLQTVPYLVLMLACGVCLLRMLREARSDGLRQGVYIAVFVIACAGLTVGRAPQMLVKALGYLWQYALAPAIFVAAILFAALFYVGYLVLRWLVARARGQDEPLDIDARSAAQMMGLEEQYDTYVSDLRWLRTILIVLTVCLLLFFLVRFFRKLLGEKAAGPERGGPWRETRIVTPAVAAKHVGSFLRPRDPRLAVRYYYARFLAECRRRGCAVSAGMTVTELTAHCASRFPDADPKVLSALYIPARYSAVRAVTAADARRAEEAWRALKRSPMPGEETSRENNRKSP